jgi:hypothetical protein
VFADRDTARHVLTELHAAASALDYSVQVALERCSEEELEVFRRAIGEVLGELWDRALGPIYARHPELRPPELDSSDT